MALTKHRDIARDNRAQKTSDMPAPAPTTNLRQLLISLLKMLEPYVREANIELKNGENVTINKDREVPIQIHCGGEKKPCADVEMVEGCNGELFALCMKLSQSPDYVVTLDTIRSNRTGTSGVRLRSLSVIPAETNREFLALKEVADMRQRILNRIENELQIMSTEDKASLLVAFGEKDFKSFLDKSNSLDMLQSIKYSSTHRINEIKIQSGGKRPKRPVKEQRKVGDCLYMLQPGQKGGDYWYVQFNENGKRKQLYLGKERPSFDPAKDLARKQKAMSASAHG